MSTTGDIRPPERNIGGTLIVAYFKDQDDAGKAIRNLREKGFRGDDIGVGMRSDDFSKHEKWIAEMREVLDEPGTMEESARETLEPSIDQRAAEHFHDKLEDGGIVIGVRCDSANADDVEELLEDADGDVAREPLEARMGEVRGMPTAGRAETAEGRRIQLRGEMLRVQKERINRGEVRLRKETVTEHQKVDVPVTREEVVIERTGPTGEAPRGQIGEDKEIRIPVSEETARVEKTPTVIGEVRAEKREVTRNQQVGGDVRHEELRVEKQGDVDEAIEDRDKGKRAA